MYYLEILVTSKMWQKPFVHLTFNYKWGQRNTRKAEPVVGCLLLLLCNQTSQNIPLCSRKQTFTAASWKISLIISCLICVRIYPSLSQHWVLNKHLLISVGTTNCHMQNGTDLNNIRLERVLAHSHCRTISENYVNWQNVRDCKDLPHKPYYIWATSKKILL